MICRRILTVALTLTCASSARAAGDVLVTFEGLGLAEGSPVLSIPGAPEVTLSGASLVRPGSNPYTGFNGNSTGSGAGGLDDANSGDTVSYPDETGGTLAIVFDRAVSEVGLDAVDIDTSGSVVETLEIRVYDAPVGGALLYTHTVFPGDPGTGDGTLAPVDLSTGFVGASSIRRLEIQGQFQGAAATNPGYAIDNVTYTPVEGTWTDLGGGTVGVAGQPTLSGTGSLVGGTTASVSLVDAPANAPMLAWISFAPTPFAALGGTVHAFPFASQLFLFADAAGSFAASTTWPAGIPAGTDVSFQFIVQDLGVPDGLTLSNGLRATTP